MIASSSGSDSSFLALARRVVPALDIAMSLIRAVSGTEPLAVSQGVKNFLFSFSEALFLARPGPIIG